MNVLLELVLHTCFGLIAYQMAVQKNRNGVLWFMSCYLFSFLPILILLFLSPLPQKTHNDIEVVSTSVSLDPEPVEEWTKGAHENPYTFFWYYLNESRAQQGPVHFDEIRKLYKAGSLQAHSYVWHEGLEEWKPIREFQEFLA